VNASVSERTFTGPDAGDNQNAPLSSPNPSLPHVQHSSALSVRDATQNMLAFFGDRKPRCARVCTCVCVSLCECVYVFSCVSVCVRLCLLVSLGACVYVFACMCASVRSLVCDMCL
jgi:hypothetical protein